MKAILRKGEEEAPAESYPNATMYTLIRHGVLYDYAYTDDEDTFFIIVDGYLFEEVSTCFDFIDDEN